MVNSCPISSLKTIFYTSFRLLRPFVNKRDWFVCGSQTKVTSPNFIYRSPKTWTGRCTSLCNSPFHSLWAKWSEHKRLSRVSGNIVSFAATFRDVAQVPPSKEGALRDGTKNSCVEGYGQEGAKKLWGPLSPAPFFALFHVHLEHFPRLAERKRKRLLHSFVVCPCLW